MTGKYQPYPEYKGSGSEQLGKIPIHWVVCHLDKMIDPVRRITYGIVQPGPPDPTGRFMVRGQDYSRGWCDRSSIFRVSDKVESPYKRARLQTGDVLLTIVGAGVGNTEIVPHWLEGGNITQTTARLAPYKRKACTEYIRYLFGSAAGKANVELSSKGAAQPGLNLAHVAKYRFAFPPLEEQHTIAAFLDYETSRIDALIAKQQRLIELLKEKRQAVISHAVTKGLNPDAPMKDSGVEWLGEVPGNWKVKQYRYATQLFRGKFGHRPRNDPSLYDGDYPFIQTGDVARAEKFIETYKQTLNEKGKMVSQKFPSGTLVMAIAANIGDTAILNFEAYCPDSVVGFRPNRDVSIEFLRFSFTAALQALEQTSTQSTQANLNLDRIGSVSAAFPSMQEQLRIVEELESMELKFDRIESKAKAGIELLQERRTALISAAVTGKIDLRGWQPPAQESAA